METEKQFVGTAEAAKILGVTVQVIYKYLKMGKLTKYQPVKKIYISAEELQNFKAKQKK